MIYGYCRVSTRSQINGNGLEAQEKEILDKYDNAKIYKEQGSGANADRPVLKGILKELKKGDTLVVNKLDRLARNTKEGIEIVEDLFNKDVSVHVLNVGLLENTTMGRFFLTTLLAVAEMERNIILERMHAGKEIAKLSENYKDGRPKVYKKKQIEHALELLEKHTYREVSQLTGMSKSTLIRAKKSLLQK